MQIGGQDRSAESVVSADGLADVADESAATVRLPRNTSNDRRQNDRQQNDRQRGLTSCPASDRLFLWIVSLRQLATHAKISSWFLMLVSCHFREVTQILQAAPGRQRLRAAAWIPAIVTLLLACLACAVDVAAATPPVRVIRSGCEVDYPPFCFVDEHGAATGFSVELMQAAARTMGREVRFHIGSWSEVKGLLERSEIDALPLVGRTPEREPLFEFTFPYMSLHGAIVVRAETSGIGNLDDLRGRRVAVMKGDNAEEFLRREERGIEIHTTSTFEEALHQLSAGRHDAVVIQRLVAMRVLQQTPMANLRILSEPIEGFRQDFCFAVKREDRENLALLNEGLSLVMADGTYRRLHAKWFAALELPATRRLVIGGDHGYPPYEYLDWQGRPAGYNVDLTRAIAREMGLNIEIRLGPWTDILRGLETGEIDVVQGMFFSPERDKRFDFGPTHAMNHYVGVIRRGQGTPPANLADLAGKRIVVQQGDVLYDFLIENGLESQVSVVDSQEAVLREVAEGNFDCGVIVRISALHLIQTHGWKNLELGQRPVLTTEYCYAVSSGQQALLTQFSEGLRVLRESGEYRQIYDKWLGVYEESPLRLATILRYVAMVAGPLLLLVVASVLWSWSLSREVARRTAELRQSQETQLGQATRLQQTQKMESIGKLAGGVAHDFNNLLSVILGYVGLAQAEVRRDEPLYEMLLEIKNAGERAATLTRQLLAFSRKQVLQPVPFDVNQVVSDIEKMLRRILGEDIALQVTLAPGLDPILADPSQIEQVIMNLAINARDAMPTGGQLTIETTSVVIDQRMVSRYLDLAPGRYVLLAVTDTGMGMDTATLDRLFEPFFTTKEMGKGTGLGLATVYGILKQTGGAIDIISELGQGTTCKVYLPPTDPASLVIAEPGEEAIVRGRGERILVVEDEAALRVLLNTTLTAWGYRVTLAADAEQALAAFTEMAGQVDLVLSDVIMPGINGKVLAEQLRNIRPDLKVLFMSGYMDNVILYQGGFDSDTPFIEKPFRWGDLSSELAALLQDGKPRVPTKVSILMIDDEETLRDLVSWTCRKRGHDFVGVGNIAAALEVLAAKSFDILLVDMNLRGQDGADALREIRAAGHASPAVIFSGDTSTVDMNVLRPLGALACVEKSGDMKPLMQVIEDVINREAC